LPGWLGENEGFDEKKKKMEKGVEKLGNCRLRTSVVFPELGLGGGGGTKSKTSLSRKS